MQRLAAAWWVPLSDEGGDPSGELAGAVSLPRTPEVHAQGLGPGLG